MGSKSIIAIAACAVVLAWVGCGDETNEQPGPAGGNGQGGTVTTASTTTTTSTALEPCLGNAPDGFCDAENDESCECVDCMGTGWCDPGACDVRDGYCDPFLDSCVCPDCDTDYYCADPVDYNCEEDGLCEPYGEGCACADCYNHSSCVDNVVGACDGDAADDLCDLPQDTCACVDCLGTVACSPCEDDNLCGFAESCLCPDCLSDPFCTDPLSCADDGVCAPLYEGCGCADCTTEPQCGGGTGGAGGN